MGIFARVLIGGLLLLQGGCALLRPSVPAAALSQRILPPSGPGEAAGASTSWTVEEVLPTPRPAPRVEAGAVSTSKPLTPPGPPSPPPDTCALTLELVPETCAVTLELALDMAQRANPNLQAMRERVTQAEAGQTVSFAEFLPDSRILYRHIEDRPGSEPFVLPTLPTNLVGNLAFGGSANRFDLTELHLQWTLSDFGRRAGKYGQAKLRVDIARLQYRRAVQSVAFNVAA